MEKNSKQAAWNVFQGKLRILKKKQQELLRNYRKKLTEQQIAQLKNQLDK